MNELKLNREIREYTIGENDGKWILKDEKDYKKEFNHYSDAMIELGKLFFGDKKHINVKIITV